MLGVYIDAITEAEFRDELIREDTSDEDQQEEQMNAMRTLIDVELEDLRLFKLTVSVPEKSRVLAQHVLGINGPKLPDDMTKHTSCPSGRMIEYGITRKSQPV